MILTPEMCRAARALLHWNERQLAIAAKLSRGTVGRFEGGGIVRPFAAEALRQALQELGIQFIAAGDKSLDGGPRLRTIPMAEPEVLNAEEALELNKTAQKSLDEI